MANHRLVTIRVGEGVVVVGTHTMGHFTAATLRPLVGHDFFYGVVAELDPANAGQWLMMVEVQRTFAVGEPDYGPAGLAYSQSMRHTLHWAMVFIFEAPALLARAQAGDGGLLGYFVRLHPAAFKANGACELGLGDMLAVTFNTHRSMVSTQTARWLLEGMTREDEYAVARRAAAHVRALRSTARQPVTVDGYAPRPWPTHDIISP